MKTAVLCFSPQAADIATRFFSSWDLYGRAFDAPVKKDDFGRLFVRYDRFLFIGAVGIAVRYIAPFVDDKRRDPAVVVVDPLGRYAIPILSGHLGGANAFSLEVADILHAQPIITTASDGLKFQSIDLFAKENGYVVASMERMRRVASAMVAGKRVAFYSEETSRPDYPFVWEADFMPEADIGEGVVVSRRPLNLQSALQLIPRRVHLGVGSKKGTRTEDLLALIRGLLDEFDIDARALCAAHTIDIKKDEPSIREACDILNVPLYTYDAATLSKKEARCSGSDFVKRTVGVKSVSCPAALMGGEKILVEKVKKFGFTVTLTEEIS
ncbi:MAG: cobalt-precorrin 5A hydrolase [Peptoniphilus sp.]|nr:cobalt-precorrin 5A hydrolase [Peptoniphilus sp.]MDD7363721.1 cobalt-precorrin 5A hydrolase [Bacillota bacterium]MDY6044106.1 cobalt-precorrin 5A hydrolase [Peptoniphilus sp.]